MTRKMTEEQEKLALEVIEKMERGWTPPQVAESTGKAPQTIRSVIAKLQQEQGVLLQYRELQNLKLTELQHSILEAITPEKIADAPLNTLVQAYKILKDKELVMTGNPTDIKGLVGYLVKLEKQEAALNIPADNDVYDITEESDDGLPKLH